MAKTSYDVYVKNKPRLVSLGQADAFENLHQTLLLFEIRDLLEKLLKQRETK